MIFSDRWRSKKISAADYDRAATFASEHVSRLRCRAMVLASALILSGAITTKAQTQSPAQTVTQTADETKGKTTGNYNVEQTVEFGYRDTMIGGNLNNYNTFEN